MDTFTVCIKDEKEALTTINKALKNNYIVIVRLTEYGYEMAFEKEARKEWRIW